MGKTKRTDTVRASRAGHTFHERWAARRILQLVFPKDRLFAVAVEGISGDDPVSPGAEAEDVADLVLYYGAGSTFETCERLETVQFKYQVDPEPVTSSYLKKTFEKFADSIVGYEMAHGSEAVDAKLSFSFVTNTDLSDALWKAIEALKSGTTPAKGDVEEQYRYLGEWIRNKQVEPRRLLSLTKIQALEKSLPALSGALKRTMTDWSAGSDGTAKVRLHELKELVIAKAGPTGSRNNLIKREDILVALGCEPEDLFPADSQFLAVGEVVERSELGAVAELIRSASFPVFLHADGGVGKTVFVQSLASNLASEFEVVLFDCFGGGSYRSEAQARHLPKVGLVQIVNELASRGVCDPLLPGDSDRYGMVRAARNA